MSGRIYFAIGDKAKIKMVADAGQPAGNGMQLPAGWVSGDPNYNVIHDWIEFTFNNTGIWANTTNVDMFSIPMKLEVIGNSTQSTGELKANGRANVFAALRANPSFQNLIINDGTRDLRALAPPKGGSSRFSATYFDNYIKL